MRHRPRVVYLVENEKGVIQRHPSTGMPLMNTNAAELKDDASDALGIPFEVVRFVRSGTVLRGNRKKRRK